MSDLFRKLKAAMTIGILWAVVWAVAGAGIALWYGGGWPFDGLADIVTYFAGIFSAVGFVGGTSFALGLAAAEKNRTLEDLSRIRIGLLGTLAGVAALPAFDLVQGLIFGFFSFSSILDPVALTVTALIGAGSSLGTLAIARSAPALPAAESEAQLVGSGEE